MGRAPCCDKANVKKGPWSPEEDAKLKSYIEQHGTGGNWIALPQKMGLRRCGKSCRLRWLNYLRPNIKHGGFSEEEDSLICSLYVSIGSRWSIIAAQLPGRTDNDIKNYWNTRLKKKLLGKQRKEYTRRRRNNIAVKKGESENNYKESFECPNSFSSNQTAPYLPELPDAAIQMITMPNYSNVEEAADLDIHTSIRKLTMKTGRPEEGLPQYFVGQSSSSASQNPNRDHEPQPAAALSCAIDVVHPQFVGAEGTQCFFDPQRQLGGLEFLLAEDTRTEWNSGSSLIQPDFINMGSSNWSGIQQQYLLPESSSSLSNYNTGYSMVQ